MTKQIDLKYFMGSPKDGKVSAPVVFEDDKDADILEPQTRESPGFSPEAPAQSDKRNGSKSKDACDKPARMKSNFFCRTEHVSYLRMLASFRRTGPGAVLDDALSRYFSEAEIVSELQKAYEDDIKNKSKERLNLESGFKIPEKK